MRRAIPTVVIAALCCAGCGEQPRASSSSASAANPQANVLPSNIRAHPQAVEPVAGAGAAASPSSQAGQPAVVSVGNSTSGGGSLPQPVPLSVVKRELAQSGATASSSRATLTANGLALAPANAPLAVQEIIAAGNQIAHLPYRFGGGHASFQDTAYDCSGSISYVLAAAGMLDAPVDSTVLMSWGAPGPGQWITVFANPGHTFMYVAGLRFDTVALAETGTRWSNSPADDGGTYVERHPPGM